MTFTAPNFLFLFFPLTAILFFIVRKEYRKALVLISSIIFYAATNIYALIVVLSLTWGVFTLGRKIYARREKPRSSKRILVIGILINVILLFFIKLFSLDGDTLLSRMLSGPLHAFILNNLIPLGISYIAFQNISYLVDIHNEYHEPEDRFDHYLIYTLFFPKILVGPIMRYRAMAEDIRTVQTTRSQVYLGVRRFIIGMAKKALIADTIARTINPGWDLSSPQFSAGMAWFLLIGYAIQLYFDFSGFTDMAIGLGQILGFTLVENFDRPYTAQSLTDFWRRWHISLSSWVRDYIFIPLEFKRRRVKFARQQTNIIIAFLVMGLWHGLTWNFVLWGVINGVFLALEMTFLGKWLKKAWRPIRHIYTLCVVLLGWLFFRANSLTYGLRFFSRLFGAGSAVQVQPFVFTKPLPLLDNSVWLALITGILLSIPYLGSFLKRFVENHAGRVSGTLLRAGADLLLVCLFILSIASLVNASVVGNIYGGF